MQVDSLCKTADLLTVILNKTKKVVFSTEQNKRGFRMEFQTAKWVRLRRADSDNTPYYYYYSNKLRRELPEHVLESDVEEITNQLPPGWVQRQTSEYETFYYHVQFKVSTFDRPSWPDLEGREETLARKPSLTSTTNPLFGSPTSTSISFAPPLPQSAPPTKKGHSRKKSATSQFLSSLSKSKSSSSTSDAAEMSSSAGGRMITRTKSSSDTADMSIRHSNDIARSEPLVIVQTENETASSLPTKPGILPSDRRKSGPGKPISRQLTYGTMREAVKSQVDTEIADAVKQWTSKPHKELKFLEFQFSPQCIVDISCLNFGWQCEQGSDIAVESVDLMIEEQDREERHYFNNLYSKEHDHFVGDYPGIGSFVVSLECNSADAQQQFLRGILRTRRGDRRFAVVGPGGTLPDNTSERLKALKQCVVEISNAKISVCARSQEANDQMADYEERVGQVGMKFKFGVLPMLDKQTTENELFGNEHSSRKLTRFLKCLGKFVQLNQHKGFGGGLDKKRNTTGTESVYTTFGSSEIMFHVSTLLPYREKDVQQLERKRHIGNDCVVIIFQETETPFNPEIMSSHFNHVYVVVRPLRNDFYQVNVLTKPGTAAHPPIEFPSIWKRGDDFRAFLLTKLINAERVSLRTAPAFKSLMMTTRESLLKEFISRNPTRSTGTMHAINKRLSSMGSTSSSNLTASQQQQSVSINPLYQPRPDPAKEVVVKNPLFGKTNPLSPKQPHSPGSVSKIVDSVRVENGVTTVINPIYGKKVSSR